MVDKGENYYFNGFLPSRLLVIAAVSFQGDFIVLCHASYWLLLHGTVDSDDVVQQQRGGKVLLKEFQLRIDKILE